MRTFTTTTLDSKPIESDSGAMALRKPSLRGMGLVTSSRSKSPAGQ